VRALGDLGDVPLRRIWDGVAARSVDGERLTLAVVELDPGSVVPEHAHEHEQLGLLLRGQMTFRVGDETRALEPGATWRIPSNVPHEVTVGPEGAVVVDVFAPVRGDWTALETEAGRSLRWP
jgi:quercetin dioxygenase-like cupin family protein